MSGSSFARRIKAAKRLASVAERVQRQPGVSAAAEILIDAEVSPEDGAAMGARSALNHDGVPLQLCLSAGRDECRLRLIADPATDCLDPAARYQRSRRLLDRLLDQRLEKSAATAMRTVVEASLHASGPATAEELARFDAGVLWLASEPGRDGWGMYVDAPWHIDEAWTRLSTWGRAVLSQPMELESIGRLLKGHARPSALALEGAGAKTRAKAYFRLDPRFGFRNEGLPLLGDREVLRFLELTLRDRSFGAHALLLCWGFDPETGAVIDFKIDLCAHCVAHAGAQWAAILDAVTHETSVHAMPAMPWFDEGLRLSFVGYGRDVHGRQRLNTYWAASAEDS